MRYIQSYGGFAIILHWLMALLIALVLVLGWWMGDMPKGADKLQMMGRHQTIGLLIFGLVFVRLAWRRVHGVPAMPLATSMDKLAALVQMALYVLMLAIPLLGYFTASFGGHPVTVFGGISVPLLTAQDHGTHELMGDAHQALAYVMLALIALHAAGALKHHFMLHDDVLVRMLPMLKRKD